MSELPEEDVRLALESFKRIDELGYEVVGAKFYDKLFARNSAIKTKFASTNFEKQRELLWQGVWSLLLFASGDSAGEIAIDWLGIRHSRKDLNIAPELYQDWADSIIDIVADSDPECSERVLEAWRRSIQPGIEFMRSKY